MKYAVADGLISKNPCLSLDLDIPSDKKTEREALPIDQYKDILMNLTKLNKNDQRFMGLLMYTGMRRGEALGLRWEDIDLENNVLHIRRNVTHPQRNAPEITTPKTKAGRRDIPIDENLLVLLMPVQEHGFIIGGTEDPLTLSAHRNMWKRINKQINLYGASAHVLRHSYLTYLQAAGLGLLPKRKNGKKQKKFSEYSLRNSLAFLFSSTMFRLSFTMCSGAMTTFPVFLSAFGTIGFSLTARL